jgi:glutathione S-transferase
MKLIGMLDSPYVRRVAICLKLLKLDFEHRSISVFSTYEQFKQINPVVKAPTLVLDNGQTLSDSTLIIDDLAAYHQAIRRDSRHKYFASQYCACRRATPC